MIPPGHVIEIERSRYGAVRVSCSHGFQLTVASHPAGQEATQNFVLEEMAKLHPDDRPELIQQMDAAGWFDAKNI